MNIIFIILKVIGILLLIVLFLILLVLFHPVFYKLKGNAEDSFYLEGHLWWLFHIFSLDFQIEDTGSNVQLKIFGFSKKKKESLQTDEEIAEEIITDTEQQAEHTVSRQKVYDTENDYADKENEDDTGSGDKDAGPADQEYVDTEHKSTESKDRTDTDKTKKKKGNKTKDWLSILKREISDERNQSAVRKFFEELLYLLSKIKPKYCKADISFATGDPALTGEVTGALSLIPLFYQKRVHVYPDFTSDEFYIRGDLMVKGYMALFYLLRSGIHILRDKNIKRLWHKIRK